MLIDILLATRLSGWFLHLPLLYYNIIDVEVKGCKHIVKLVL